MTDIDNGCAFADEGCTCGRPSLRLSEDTEIERLRGDLERTRENRDRIAQSLDAVWDALGLETASDGNAVDAIRKLSAELAEVRNQAHRDATNHQQIVRANTELANERDAMREVVEAAKGVVGAYRAEGGPPITVALARLYAAVSLHDHSCPNCAPGYDCGRGIYTPAVTS